MTLLLLSGGYCAAYLPRVAVGLCVVCSGGFSWSFSLAFCCALQSSANVVATPIVCCCSKCVCVGEGEGEVVFPLCDIVFFYVISSPAMKRKLLAFFYPFMSNALAYPLQ